MWSCQRWYADLWYGPGFEWIGRGADSSRRMIGLTGGITDVVRTAGSVGLAVAPERNLASAAGRDFQSAPLIIPTRGHLDSIKRLMKGDLSEKFRSQRVRKSVQGGSAQKSKSY